MNTTRIFRSAALLAVLCAAQGVFPQNYRIDVKGSMSWERRELRIDTIFDLESAGLRMPTGRSQAEVLADMEFPRLARPTLYAIPVDSSTTVETMVQSGTLSPSDIGAIAASARRSASVLSADLRSLASSYLIDLGSLASGLVRHSKALQPPRTLEMRPTKTYTGIVVYADEELPLHGTRTKAYAEPCFFPKIWDSEMRLIYERNMVDPGTARRSGIVVYAKTDSDPRVAARAGKTPLRVLARGLFGKLPTDPIIDRDDALKILSSDENRALLGEGRVVIVLGAASVGNGL